MPARSRTSGPDRTTVLARLRVLALGCSLVSVGAFAGGCGSSGTTSSSDFTSDAGSDGATHGGKADAARARDAGGGHHSRDATGGGTKDAHGGGSSSARDGGSASDGAVAVPEGGRCPDASVVDGATVLDCTGKCGPVLDPCTGTTTECGGCAPGVGADGGTAPRVCNLTTNTCGPVETTCAELGAQCGTAMHQLRGLPRLPRRPDEGVPQVSSATATRTSARRASPRAASTWASSAVSRGSGWWTRHLLDLHRLRVVPGHRCLQRDIQPVRAGLHAGHAGHPLRRRRRPVWHHHERLRWDRRLRHRAGPWLPQRPSCGVAGEANRCDPALTPLECVALGKNCGSITSTCTGQMIERAPVRERAGLQRQRGLRPAVRAEDVRGLHGISVRDVRLYVRRQGRRAGAAPAASATCRATPAVPKIRARRRTRTTAALRSPTAAARTRSACNCPTAGQV